MSLIYSRSPFFIQSTSGSTATVSLYVWNGNSSDVPTSAQYTLTKAHNSEGKATFEVSELIRDYVDQSFNGDYVTEAVWVYISVADGFGTSTSGKYLATDGYIDEDFVQYVAVNQDNTITSITKNPTGDGTVSEIILDNGMAGYECEVTSSGRAFVTMNATVVSGAQYTVSAYVELFEGVVMTNFLDITSGGDNVDRSSNTIEDGKIEYTFTSTSTSLSFRMGIGATSNQTTPRKTIFGGLQIVAGSSSADAVKANLKSDEVLISNDYISIPEDTTATIPTKGADMAVFYKDGEVKFISELASDSSSSGAINYATSAGQSASTFYARVIVDGGTVIDENCSDNIMAYVSELDIDEAHIIKSDGKVEVITVETLPCNKYENVRLTFVNKFGALQDIHFSAKTTESMTGKGSSYNSINFDYDNLSNNYSSHSVRDFNKNATVRHTLNTDYLHESYSEVFRQLIVSEEVWMEHKGTVKPVNVTTNSLQKKTHANNGLVQFTISVKESHSLINNIR